ncbi:MAG: hypothetical protein FWE98_09050, partial [Oscillospiraceae bacterium]|nr:hypothetical protein [Oscillospiraceae bacterium]
ALTIMFFICVPMGEEGMIYVAFNPIGVSFGEIVRRLDFDLIHLPDSLNLAMVLLTHVLPAVFFYLGMVLRKKALYLKNAREGREAQGVQCGGEDTDQQ